MPADDLPSIAVMVPMHSFAERTLSSVWSSWYKLKYPKENLKFFFAIPEDSPKRTFVRENFHGQHEILSFKLNYVTKTDNRFFELAKVRDLLLTYGKEYDYGWFLDSDVMPPPNTINCFLEDQADIVGGIVLVPDNKLNIRLGFGYFGPYYDFSNSLPREEFFEVHSVNTACMFLSKHLMNDKRISFKLFRYTSPEVKDKMKDNVMSEDHGFCYNALKHGYTAFVDNRVRCKHLRNFGNRIMPLALENYS